MFRTANRWQRHVQRSPQCDFTRFINWCPSESSPLLATLYLARTHFSRLDSLYFGHSFQRSQCLIGPTIKAAVEAALLEEDAVAPDVAEAEAVAVAEAAVVEASNVGGTQSGGPSVWDKRLLRYSLIFISFLENFRWWPTIVMICSWVVGGKGGWIR